MVILDHILHVVLLFLGSSFNFSRNASLGKQYIDSKTWFAWINVNQMLAYQRILLNIAMTNYYWFLKLMLILQGLKIVLDIINTPCLLVFWCQRDNHSCLALTVDFLLLKIAKIHECWESGPKIHQDGPGWHLFLCLWAFVKTKFCA